MTKKDKAPPLARIASITSCLGLVVLIGYSAFYLLGLDGQLVDEPVPVKYLAPSQLPEFFRGRN